MEKWMQALAIILVCGLVILIGRFKKAGNLILNFLFRAVVGAALIFACNFVLSRLHLSYEVGLNPVTLLTCGFFGIPGVAGLFCLRFLIFL